jgi:hypothetical protein
MKDAYEVLYQKETDLVRVRREVQSLRVAASLLGNGTQLDNQCEMPDKKSAENALPPQSENQATGTNGIAPNSRQPHFWEAFTRRRR